MPFYIFMYTVPRIRICFLFVELIGLGINLDLDLVIPKEIITCIAYCSFFLKLCALSYSSNKHLSRIFSFRLRIRHFPEFEHATISPFIYGGGGDAYSFLRFTQNIFGQHMPENAWPCKTFCCGCPYEEKKIKKFSVSPSQSTLKYGSENNPWRRGLKVIPQRIAANQNDNILL